MFRLMTRVIVSICGKVHKCTSGCSNDTERKYLFYVNGDIKTRRWRSCSYLFAVLLVVCGSIALADFVN